MTTLKQICDELTETAILGTNRRPPTVLSNSGSGSLIERTLLDIDQRKNVASNDPPPETALLDKLTALSLTRKSGQLPRRFEQVQLPVCPPESKQEVGAKSLSLLKRIIEPESKGGEARRLKLLDDWLEACLALNLRVPAEFVPRLLEALVSEANGNRSLADKIAPVCGNRFDWLADLNPRWRGDAGQINAREIQEIFETGEPAARVLALNQWREKFPAEALAALANLWSQESGESRAQLLKCLNAGLSDSDEPFLEEALKDRRKEVRLAAAQLLAAIPQSRYIARMIERAAACFTIRPEKNGDMSMSLPESLDDQAVKDGISDNISVGFNLGKKAGWLVQFLSFVDPAIWLEKYKLTAARFLEIVFSDADWQRVFEIGLISATNRYRNNEMMAALISCEKVHLTESQAGLALLKLLPASLLEAHISGKLPAWSREKGGAPRLDLWYYLEATSFDWSESFTRAILAFIIKECGQAVPVFGPTFTANAGDYALRMHLGAADLIEQVALNEATDAILPNALERLTDTYKMRLEIAESFSNTSVQPDPNSKSY